MEQAAQQGVKVSITLRKANAIQQSILDMIRGIPLESTVSINEFENPDEKIVEATTKLGASIAAVSQLYQALYGIRLLVGEANAKNGIDSLLTNIAHTEKNIQLNTQVGNFPARTNIEVIKGKLDKIKTTEATSVYSRSNEVTTGVMTDTFINQYKLSTNSMKKAKQQMQDKVLELNIKTEIELPSAIVAILQDADLL